MVNWFIGDTITQQTEFSKQGLSPDEIAQQEANQRQKNFIENWQKSYSTVTSFEKDAYITQSTELGRRIEQRENEIVTVPAIEVFGYGIGTTKITRAEARQRNLLTEEEKNAAKRREDRAKELQYKVEQKELELGLREPTFTEKLGAVTKSITAGSQAFLGMNKYFNIAAGAALLTAGYIYFKKKR
jgi:hypothetical protein